MKPTKCDGMQVRWRACVAKSARAHPGQRVRDCLLRAAAVPGERGLGYLLEASRGCVVVKAGVTMLVGGQRGT